MKNFTFPRLIKWLLATGLALLLLMFALRLVFFYYFKPAQTALADYWKPFLLGLRFDLRVACVLVLLPYLAGNFKITYAEERRISIGSLVRILLALLLVTITLIVLNNNGGGLLSIAAVILVFILFLTWLFITKNCNPYENDASKKIYKIYWATISICLALFYAFDFQHYDYLQQRLNASVLNYTEDATISMKMIWQTYPVGVLLSLVLVVSLLAYSTIIFLFAKFKNARYRGHEIVRLMLSYAFIFLLALGIFGRLNQYPLRWSDAYSFDNDFKANLALNPFQSFFSTLGFRHSGYDAEKVKKYYPLVADYLHVQDPDSASLDFKRSFHPVSAGSSPNVVIVICESFSAYKSSMWGNPLNTTPFFNQMCENGILFDRCFSPSYGTARGVWAIITGIPDVEYPNTSSRNPAYVDQHSILNDYPGYEKLYFLGGSSSWANVRGLLTHNIAGLRLYEEDSYKAEAIDVWGISDKRLFLEANKTLSEQTKPFIAVIQTADNHRPYTIPEEDRSAFVLKTYSRDSLLRFGFQSNEELNAFRYTDFSFRKFIEAARKEKYFDNTIFVFIGDHGIRGDAGAMFPKAWTLDGLTTYHVPLLFYAPRLLKPTRNSNTCSQLDVLPSVTALANLPFENSTMGKNLFDTAMNTALTFTHSAFLFDYSIKQIGIVTDEYLYLQSLLTGRENFNSLEKTEATPAEAEKNKEALRKLSEAYYETARFMLLNNKNKK